MIKYEDNQPRGKHSLALFIDYNIEQSKLVTQIIVEYMSNIDIKEEIKTLKHIKKEVVDDYMRVIYKGYR